MSERRTPPGGIAAMRRLSILHVEDDSIIAAGVRRMIAAYADVDIVGTIAEACARIGTRIYDAVILDPGLPDSRGVDSIATLRARTAVPIVVLTSADESTAERAIAAGASYWLSKMNIDAPTLIRAIRIEISRMYLERARLSRRVV